MNYPFITIEGNIGAGKTTLAQLLSQHFQARLILEEFADNPFLPKFYENPQQFAFPLELFFMAERYKQLKELLQQRDMFQQDQLIVAFRTCCPSPVKSTGYKRLKPLFLSTSTPYYA